MGLVIQGIEPGGRIHDDGRLHPQDRIIEINGTSLVDVDFNKYVVWLHREIMFYFKVALILHITKNVEITTYIGSSF